MLREVGKVLRNPNTNAIVLFGQRRIGKTSILSQLELQLESQHEYTPVYFDLMDKASKPLKNALYEMAKKSPLLPAHLYRKLDSLIEKEYFYLSTLRLH